MSDSRSGASVCVGCEKSCAEAVYDVYDSATAAMGEAVEDESMGSASVTG